MAVRTRTVTRTRTITQFADPYKTCDECGDWIVGVYEQPGPIVLAPCGHRANYSDRCPSWGPIDGCSCQEHLGHVPHGQPPATEVPR